MEAAILNSLRRKRRLRVALCLRLRSSLRRDYNIHSSSLLPSVVECPWYIMYSRGSDDDFLNTVSLTRSSFDILLQEFMKHYEIRSGPGLLGRPRRVRDIHCVLAILLHSYCSPADRKTWSEFFGVHKSTLSRLLNQAENSMLITLQNLRDARIEWPSLEDQRRMAALVNRKEPLIHGRWGFIDGKNYRVEKSGNSDIQNSTYNGWLHACLITNTLCFDADGLIVWANLNWFGSFNDGETSRTFREKLCDPRKNVDGYGVISDTAFPVSKEMYTRIITPLKEGELDRAPLATRAGLQTMSNAITAMRQAAEWGMDAVAKPYRILDKKLNRNPERRGRLLRVVHMLYNYRVRTTGISQIRSFFHN